MSNWSLRGAYKDNGGEVVFQKIMACNFSDMIKCKYI